MKYANGKARTASVNVTSAAMPIVRSMMARYVAFPNNVRKLPRPQTRSMFVVKLLILQNAVISRIPSDAR